MRKHEYNLVSENGSEVLDHEQVMKWAKNGSCCTKTMDDYMAQNFDIKSEKDNTFVGTLYANLLKEAKNAGIIDIDISSLSNGKIWVVPGHFPSKYETDKTVTIANSDHTYGKMYIAAHVHSANRAEFNEGITNGTLSFWYLGNSGNAINILGVHEPMHGQPGFNDNSNSTHVKIYKQILYDPAYRKSLILTTPEYQRSLLEFIRSHDN